MTSHSRKLTADQSMLLPDTLLALKRQVTNLRDLIRVEYRRSQPDQAYLDRLERNLKRALDRIYGASTEGPPESQRTS